MTRAADINLTAIMVREHIVAIKSWLMGERYSVELADGRLGIGHTVGEAMKKAKRPDAENIRRTA